MLQPLFEVWIILSTPHCLRSVGCREWMHSVAGSVRINNVCSGTVKWDFEWRGSG